MWNVLITSFFVVSSVGLIRSELFNVSAKIAVVVGKSAELSCKRDDINDVKYWDHYTLSEINGSWSWNNARIYNGVDMREEFKSSMNWTRNARGKWILHITLVNMSNSGYYKCMRSEQLNNSSISLTEVVLELIVLASDPQCNVSQEVLKEGEYIELWCSLKYFGSMPPVMKWSKSGIDPEAAISNGSIYNVTLNEVMSQLYVKADSSLHNSKYICNCYFESSCYQAGLLECAAPDYEFTWISPILLVEYQPKYIDINPVKKVFYPGEIVNCSADGYPSPHYKWNNLVDGTSKTHNGPILIITKEMVRDTEYIYECSASNSKDDNGIRRNITFTVKASFPILTTTTISMGILSVMLLVAILVIRLEYIKHWTAKITARFRPQANSEHGVEAGEREAAPVVPIVEEDPYGGYVGIREVGAYLEMRPESGHDEDNLAIGGIAESAEAELDCRQIKSDELHPKEMRYSSYFGADGTEYMEMNGFRPPPTTNPPTLPRITEPVMYARIDHTLPTPSPRLKKSTNFK